MTTVQRACSVRVDNQLEEGVAPLTQAVKAILLLFFIGTTGHVQPVHEHLFVFLEDEELAKYHVGLVEALLAEPLA